MTTNLYKGPLEGLTVIDFGHYYAGPMAGMMLADQGATVVRIVRPGEPELQQQPYRLLNRNKKLLTLDLKTPEGFAQAKRLAQRADVVIENFRPGVMQRLGLDYTSLKETNPRLVYLSLPGFASTDKKRRHIQAWEGILSAASCLYTEASMFRHRFGFSPLYSWVPQCSTYGAVQGVTGVMAALIAREKYGVGTLIETPLAKAGLAGFGLDFVNDRVGELRSQSKGDYEVPDTLKGLVHIPGEGKEAEWEKITAMYRKVFNAGFGTTSYPCADGREIYLSLYLSPQFVERLLKVLNLDKQVRQEGFQIVSPWERGFDNNLSNPALNNQRRERIIELVSEALKAKTAEEWENILPQAGIPAAMIRTREEWLALAPMLDSGVLTKLEEKGETLTVPGRIGDVTGPEGALIQGYREAENITAAEAEALLPDLPAVIPMANNPSLKKGDLLNGLKILDLCNVVAGPTSARTLAEFGAEVIKAEAPNGVHPRFIPSALYLNHGKRSIVTDLKTAPGQEVFARLVNWADVVVHNIMDDTVERMGASHQQLQKINPRVVSCQLSAFGGTQRGYWENRTSFDNLMQGACGLATRFGSPELPLWHGRITSADTIGGFSQAFTTLLGVYQRQKTGYAGECRTSLARATNHYQLPHMIAENGNADWGEPHGQFTLGETDYQRLYQCNDGWIYVGATTANSIVFCKMATGQEHADTQALEAGLASRSCNYWLSQLDEAGIACHAVLCVDDICAQGMKPVDNNEGDEEVTDSSLPLLRWENHTWGLPVILLAPDAVRVGETQTYKRLQPAPRYGEHTIEILGELGYSEKEIGNLLRLKVSHEYLPDMGDKESYFVKDNVFTGYGGKK